VMIIFYEMMLVSYRNVEDVITIVLLNCFSKIIIGFFRKVILWSDWMIKVNLYGWSLTGLLFLLKYL
jgi:hypothetical protein